MNWAQVPLSPSLAKVVRGVTFSQADSSSDPFEGGVPVLRAGNIQECLITDEDLVWVDRKFVSKEQYLQLNDIVVCTSSGSASLVGKSAILKKDFEGTWGAFNAVIRCNPDVLMPEYMAFWLSSAAFRAWKDRQVQGANIQNIKQSSLESMRPPIPSIPEQQRIVEVLRQAEVVDKAKKSISDQVDYLVRTAYWEHFGDWFAADGLVNPVRISDYVADSQYGVSEAMGESGTHAVLRMNSITTSGWLDLSDLKYASLSKKDISSTDLRDGDLLFNRTNSKELVGKCAVWRPVTGTYSFASYLVRFRLKPEMLPEYLWATLNSAYGKYRLLNSAKQAVSMANVSPTGLGQITVPLPPLPLQETFAKFVREIELLRAKMLSKLELYSELLEIISQRALIGELTSEWREFHADEVVEASKVRDALLRKHGAKISQNSLAKTSFTKQEDLTAPPARHRLIAELSEFQRQLLNAFIEYCQQNGQPLFVEDPEVFSRFCDDSTVTDRLQAFGQFHGNRIRRSLSQLAALGLIAKITLPKQDQDSGEYDYLKAFRPLRPEEFTRMVDLQKLRKASLADVDQQRYYFEVQLDYETSEHAGASGMFQVMTIVDEENKDFIHLVDQDQQYASLDDLKEDIARSLKAEVWQVDLEVV